MPSKTFDQMVGWFRNNEPVDLATENRTPNRHGIGGYLDDRDVARRVYDALIAPDGGSAAQQGCVHKLFTDVTNCLHPPGSSAEARGARRSAASNVLEGHRPSGASVLQGGAGISEQLFDGQAMVQQVCPGSRRVDSHELRSGGRSVSQQVTSPDTGECSGRGVTAAAQEAGVQQKVARVAAVEGEPVGSLEEEVLGLGRGRRRGDIRRGACVPPPRAGGADRLLRSPDGTDDTDPLQPPVCRPGPARRNLGRLRQPAPRLLADVPGRDTFAAFRSERRCGNLPDLGQPPECHHVLHLEPASTPGPLE